MQIVNGNRVAYHDGPNCYNATLFGKGYVSELTFVDNSEFTFYINRFCKESSGPTSPGDIVTVKHLDDSYEHAALILENGIIFEKDSTWGKHPPPGDSKLKSHESQEEIDRVTKERADSSLYKIKKMNQSSYFGDPVYKTHGRKFQSYKCRDSKEVKSELESLSLIPGVQEVLNLNKKIENLIFTDKLEKNWQEKLAPGLTVVVETAIKNVTSDDEGLYLLTKLQSLESQFWHLTGIAESPDGSSSAEFNEAYRKLKKIRELFEAKQKQNKSNLAKLVLKAL